MDGSLPQARVSSDNEDRSGTTRRETFKERQQADMGTQTKTKKIVRISIDEVRKRMGDLVFIDARSATALSRNPLQVPGAIHVPAKEVEKALERLPRNRTLVTYCT